MTDRELFKMALNELERLCRTFSYPPDILYDTINALRSRLANEFNPDWNQVEALQESLREHMAEIQRLRAALAQPESKWVGLTDEEIENCFEMSMFGTCRAIEAKLREKNT